MCPKLWLRETLRFKGNKTFWFPKEAVIIRFVIYPFQRMNNLAASFSKKVFLRSKLYNYFSPCNKSSNNETPTFSLPRRSRTMVRFLFLTAWSFVTTTDYRRRFTENPPTLTDSLTNHLTTLRHTRLQQYGP